MSVLAIVTKRIMELENMLEAYESGYHGHAPKNTIRMLQERLLENKKYYALLKGTMEVDESYQ